MRCDLGSQVSASSRTSLAFVKKNTAHRCVFAWNCWRLLECKVHKRLIYLLAQAAMLSDNLTSFASNKCRALIEAYATGDPPVFHSDVLLHCVRAFSGTTRKAAWFGTRPDRIFEPFTSPTASAGLRPTRHVKSNLISPCLRVSYSRFPQDLKSQLKPSK